MLDERFLDNISKDWIWRDTELREIDERQLRKGSPLAVKSAILVTYSHWEGHFKTCASQLLEFIAEGVRRKAFKWSDVNSDVRLRLLFCGYRKSSLAGQTHEKFASYLDAISSKRYSDILSARSEIIMIDDNLNTSRAEAICKNLGLDHSWFSSKRIVIDQRLLSHRNAFAHGDDKLRDGATINFSDAELINVVKETKSLIRSTRNEFQNSISLRSFLG